MTEPGIKRASPIEILIPGNWVKTAVGPSLVSRLVQRQQHVDIRGQVAEVIPFVDVFERLGRALRGRALPIEHPDSGLLNRGLIMEVPADQSPVPTPMVFGIRSCMNSHKTAPRLDVAFEVRLLVVVQYIARRVQEHHRCVPAQAIGRKIIGIGGCIDIETVRLTHFQQRFVACRNGLMVKPSRLAKHQYPGITLPHLWATGKLDGSISNQHAYKQPVISNFLHISILATTLKYYVFK